jgi:tRNA A-37 threonylcarbamoyl transferase component Bud32
MIETQSRSDTAVPVVIDGRYEVFLDEVIGKGGLSTVHRGREIATRQPVAVKRLHERYRNNREAVKRFNNEGRMTSFASHPNVVGYHGHFLDGPWLVLELIEGRTLKTIIEQDGPLDLRLAEGVLASVAAALDHIHGLRVVHLDLKPQNLILTDDGSVKLIDFGLAQEFAHRQDQVGGELFGTAAYLAPEQVNKEPVGKQTDVYSLGCVFHEMVTGRPPFEAPGLHGEAEQQALIELHRHAEPLPPSQVRPDLGLPVWVDDVVGRALEKRPEDRFETAGAFAQAASRGLMTATGRSMGRLAALTALLPPNRIVDEADDLDEEGADEEPRGPSLVSRAWVAGGRRLQQSQRVRHVLWRVCLLMAIVTMVAGVNVAGTDGVGWMAIQAIRIGPDMHTTVVIDDVNVRADHRTDSDIITTLPLDSEVVITGLPELGSDMRWWPIEIGVDGETVSGWVWSDGLETTGAMQVIAFPGAVADRARSISDGVSNGWDTVSGWWPW